MIADDFFHFLDEEVFVEAFGSALHVARFEAHSFKPLNGFDESRASAW